MTVNIEEVTNKIKKLELQLLKSKSKYEIEIINNELRHLKRQYRREVSIKNLKLEEIPLEIIKPQLQYNENPEIIVLVGESNKTYNLIKCSELKVVGLNNCRLTVECKEALKIEDSHNLHISCTTAQLRINTSSDLIIEGYSPTPIIIEQSNNIIISPIDKEGNKIGIVNDFTDVFTDKNYKVI